MKNCLIWFRNDLRLEDNSTINFCLKNNYKVLPVYINDESHDLGSSSKWWLKNSLKSLDKSMNGNLVLVNGDTKSLIQKLVDKYNISAICWYARYSQNEIKLDNDIEK